MSLELRWIFSGEIPNHVKQWFYHDKRHNNKVEEQKYEDVYLYNPEVDYSSVKFRDNKLDIKWKRSSFEIDVEPSKPVNISGTVEVWLFWEWNERKTAEEIGKQIAENMVHPWIRIMKKRSRYEYQYKDDSLLSVWDKGDPDCSIEIATLNLMNNKNVVWWSIGIDLFAGKNISKAERKNMKVIAQLLLSDYPDTNLISACSYSYPKLFSQNRELITKKQNSQV
jgi:hypothetical protein